MLLCQFAQKRRNTAANTQIYILILFLLLNCKMDDSAYGLTKESFASQVEVANDGKAGTHNIGLPDMSRSAAMEDDKEKCLPAAACTVPPFSALCADDINADTKDSLDVVNDSGDKAAPLQAVPCEVLENMLEDERLFLTRVKSILQMAHDAERQRYECEGSLSGEMSDEVTRSCRSDEWRCGGRVSLCGDCQIRTNAAFPSEHAVHLWRRSIATRSKDDDDSAACGGYAARCFFPPTAVLPSACATVAARPFASPVTVAAAGLPASGRGAHAVGRPCGGRLMSQSADLCAALPYVVEFACCGALWKKRDKCTYPHSESVPGRARRQGRDQVPRAWRDILPGIFGRTCHHVDRDGRLEADKCVLPQISPTGRDAGDGAITAAPAVSSDVPCDRGFMPDIGYGPRANDIDSAATASAHMTENAVQCVFPSLDSVTSKAHDGHGPRLFVPPRPSIIVSKSDGHERKPSCVLPTYATAEKALNANRDVLERIQDIVDDVYEEYMRIKRGAIEL